MKKLPLSNPAFRYLEKSFQEWLDVQGYSKSTVYNLPNHIREFLFYLEQKGLKSIKILEDKHIKGYYTKLQSRANERRGGGISAAHLNKHIQALKRFLEYLNRVGRLELGAVNIHNEPTDSKVVWLTEDEIQELFKATYFSNEYNYKQDSEAFGSRDRALLSIFYGCGLRRNEGVHLNISDIDFDRSVLHVRKGKGGKERLVPISRACKSHLIEYVYDHRPKLLKGSENALFIGKTGKRIQGQTLNLRLKYLQSRSENVKLVEKEIGLHTLRHSIATHLLNAGMKLESISKFLGHDSLESTQIYTHLEEQEYDLN